MPTRRRSTITPIRTTALELPKSVELETRVARLELIVRELVVSADLLMKRTSAMQAQLDHFVARMNRI